MKKSKFLSGISAMFAFAVVALAGFLFTSCEKEDLDATFTPDAAKAEIKVKILDSATGTEMSGVGISATTTSGTLSVNGMTITLTATGDGNLPQTTVTISATSTPTGYEEIKSETVSVAALTAGGVATYNVTMLAVPTSTSAVITYDKTEEKGDTKVSELLSPTHKHDGVSWWENATDHLLRVTVEYTQYNEVAYVENSNTVTDAEVVGNVESTIEALKRNDNVKATYEFQVSAWAIYRAYYTMTPTTITYTVKKNGTKVGEFKMVDKTSGQVEAQEAAHPGHSESYIKYHGNAGDYNAGGGIVIAD